MHANNKTVNELSAIRSHSSRWM